MFGQDLAGRGSRGGTRRAPRRPATKSRSTTSSAAPRVTRATRGSVGDRRRRARSARASAPTVETSERARARSAGRRADVHRAHQHVVEHARASSRERARATMPRTRPISVAGDREAEDRAAAPEEPAEDVAPELVGAEQRAAAGPRVRARRRTRSASAARRTARTGRADEHDARARGRCACARAARPRRQRQQQWPVARPRSGDRPDAAVVAHSDVRSRGVTRIVTMSATRFRTT